MLQSKNIQKIILGVMSIGFSKVLFWSFDDPEGANLFVVVVMVLILYCVSLCVYLFSIQKKFLLALCIQASVFIGFYMYLR